MNFSEDAGERLLRLAGEQLERLKPEIVALFQEGLYAGPVAKVDRDVISHGVFTSVSDLRRKLMRYIRQYNKAPKTIK